jgi:uncharacterized membrane protein YbhN (UPF0104 family)
VTAQVTDESSMAREADHSMPGVLGSRSVRWIREWPGFVVGFGLFAAAVWAISSQGPGLAEVWERLGNQPPWLIALAFVLPAGNWLCMSACFWVLMRDAARKADAPTSRLNSGEMTKLIGVAWLLNYVPMKPGMFGRIAYHRAVNCISLAESFRAMVLNLVAGAISIALCVAAIVLAASCGLDARTGAPWLLILAAPGLALAALGRAAGPGLWRTLMLASGIRAADLCIWTARYLVVFALIERPIALAGAMAASAASQVTSIVPFTGNGLGLREWTVGVTMSMLPPEIVASTTPASVSAASVRHEELATLRVTAITADVLNRAGELAAAIVVGLGCWWGLSSTLRHRARFRVSPSSELR